MNQKLNNTQLAFNAGEFSESASARVDMEKYLTAARILENFRINKQGEMFKRNGFDYVGAAKYANRVCRVLPFEFSRTTSFTVEFGHQYMRFFYAGSGQQVEVSAGSGTTATVPYEIATPYLEADLYEVQFSQINDVVFIHHPDYQDRKLSRLADDNWTLEAIDNLPPPLLDENISDIYLTPSAKTGTITINAAVPSGSTDDPDIFYDGHVGSIWQIRHLREGTSEEEYLDGAGTTTSTAIPIIGEWTLRTYGFWGGTLYLEKKGSGDLDFRVIRQFDGDNDRNVDSNPLDGGDTEEALYRFRFVRDAGWALPSGVTDRPRCVLEAPEAFIAGLVKITAVPSGVEPYSSVTAEVLEDIEATDDTTYWSEPLWSDYRGWSACVDSFENRRWAAGNDYRPLNFQASKTDDYEDFDYGTAADNDGMNKRISANAQNPIRWIGNLNGLLLGTSTEVWAHLTEDGDILTPTSGNVRRQTAIGSKAIQPLTLEDVLLFVHNTGRRLYELAQDNASVFSKHAANDMTVLADHIAGTGEGFITMAAQRDPDNLIWTNREDGEMPLMTYERQHNVVGWTRQVTNGVVESIAVVSERVWISVKRTLPSGEVRYIERLNNNDYKALGKLYAQLLDSASSFGPAATGTITSISNARPAVVEGDTTGLVSGDLVEPSGISGITKLNGNFYKALNITSSSFELYEEDGVTPVDTRKDVEWDIVNVTDTTPEVTVNTVLSHDLVVGDYVDIDGVTGSAAVLLNGKRFQVTSVPSGGTSVTINLYPTLLTWTANGGTIKLASGESSAGSGGTWREVFRTLSGLDHLEGLEVECWGDGGNAGKYTVSGGAITLDDPKAFGYVGLAQTALYKSMRLDATSQGNLQGKKRRISSLVVRIFESGPFEYSADGIDWYDARVNTFSQNLWGEAWDLESEDVQLSFPGSFNFEGYIYIRQASPAPLKVKAITVNFEASEGG